MAGHGDWTGGVEGVFGEETVSGAIAETSGDMGASLI